MGKQAFSVFTNIVLYQKMNTNKLQFKETYNFANLKNFTYINHNCVFNLITNVLILITTVIFIDLIVQSLYLTIIIILSVITMLVN